MNKLIAGGSTMTEDQELKGVQTMFTDEGVMAWMEEHQMELRQSVSG